MSWLGSRRLHFLVGLTVLLFGLFASLRAIFLLGFSGLPEVTDPEVLRTLGIGLRWVCCWPCPSCVWRAFAHFVG